MPRTGNIQPQLDLNEHFESADGHGAKRVVNVSVNPDGSFDLPEGKNLKFLWDDTTTTDATYLGWALPGTATSAASWKIKKVDSANKQILLADGDSDYNNIWDNRATLSYS